MGRLPPRPQPRALPFRRAFPHSGRGRTGGAHPPPPHPGRTARPDPPADEPVADVQGGHGAASPPEEKPHFAEVLQPRPRPLTKSFERNRPLASMRADRKRGGSPRPTSASGARRYDPQTPAWQLPPVGQATAHAPQCDGSAWRSKQPPGSGPQKKRLGGQAQCPCRQVNPLPAVQLATLWHDAPRRPAPSRARAAAAEAHAAAGWATPQGCGVDGAAHFASDNGRARVLHEDRGDEPPGSSPPRPSPRAP